MKDDELLAAWEAVRLGRAVTHEEHVRIVLALLRQGFSPAEAAARVVAATRANCEAAGAADKFDEALTRRWVARIADCAGAGADEGAGARRPAEAVIAAHPELLDSRLLGAPAWKN